MNRRYFLMGCASALAASPNDTVRVACVGLRGQGRTHLAKYNAMKNVEVAAFCDVDESVLRERLADQEKAGKRKPATYSDVRKLLEDKSIDAISIATPNHHHTLQTIWACQAGKDVYVEKPCSHDMFEAKQIVAAARKHNRLVQHGSNSRSSIAREAVKHVQTGTIGHVYMARGLCFKRRNTIGSTPVTPVPAGVDYDLWLGPAPVRPFTKNRFHYTWHWFWDYGNGDLGNQGIHQIDLCRWGLGVQYPTKVSAMGGHFMFNDDQETPNTLSCHFEFDDRGRKKLMTFEVRHWYSNHESGIGEDGNNTVGATFYGSKGRIAVWDEDHGRYQSFMGPDSTPGLSGNDVGNNWANFIDAVRSGKREDLNAPIEEGAISTTLVHLANISYRVGRTLNFDPVSYSVKGDAEANRLFRREYRKPFVVPEKL